MMIARKKGGDYNYGNFQACNQMENSNLSFNKKKHEAILAGTHYQILAIL